MTMDRKVFEAAASGNQSLIHRLQLGCTDLYQVTPNLNTILHVAVRFNQNGISKQLLRLCPWQLHQANADGNSPLHTAAKNGNKEIVELLIGGSEDIESQQTNITRMRNLREKDTALHVAVKNGHFGVAKFLIEKDPGSLELVNSSNESPLFLAVERSFLDIAQHILLQFPSAPCCGSNGMNALHAAVIRARHARIFEHQELELSLEKLRRKLSRFLLHAGDQCSNIGYRKAHQPTQMDIVQLLLEKGGCALAEEKDVFGWTPLHCAAHLGHFKAARLLLQRSPTHIAYLLDNKGMSALHVAAKQGHINVMKEIIGHNPDACDLVDDRGWTPLHAAIANERLNVVRYVLKKQMLESLINAADKEGNTPLHLAAAGDKYSIITILLNDPRVHNKAQNIKFQRPIDLIRNNPNIGELRKSIIATKLENQGGQPSLQSLVHGGMDVHEIAVGRENKETESHRLRSISSIHLLVASLIATVTFTAGFTMPGGNLQDKPSTGMAALSNKTSFKMFVIADSIAFYCSAASVFIQFCSALEHNYHLLLRFTRVAASLTYISSIGMVTAFASGMHAVMPKSTMLAYFTLVSGICSAVIYIFGFL